VFAGIAQEQYGITHGQTTQTSTPFHHEFSLTAMTTATIPTKRTFNIAVLPGDGIGVDVTREAVRVLEAVQATLDGVQFTFQRHSVGAGEFLKSGNPLLTRCYSARWGCRASAGRTGAR
jgi:redox-sensitive bicupin YhaK (pirin superfamily)